MDDARPEGRPPQVESDANVIVEFRHVHKWFDEFHVLRDINMVLGRGEKVVICGPSGSGKSTMIRCINRLEEHQEGTIIIDGTELTNDMRKTEEVRRGVGMVFQSFNLFPHLSVIENLTMAPVYVHGIPEDEAEGRALELLEKLQAAQKLDEAAKRAESLAEQEQALQEQTQEGRGDGGGSWANPGRCPPCQFSRSARPAAGGPPSASFPLV